MARKLVLALSLAAAIGGAGGCKEDSNTSVKFDPSGAYKQQQQQQQQYKGGGTGTTTTAGTAATTP